MRQTMWVPGPLPGLNEIIDAAKKGGRGAVYSAMKAKLTNAIALHARAAGLQPVPSARFHFLWREKTRQRNPDNIAAAHKFILDGLVVAKVIPNDGWSEILGWSDSFEVADRPGVLVAIES